MKRKIKKIFCLVFSVLMVSLLMVPGVSAAGEKSYTITNPYETVDWDSWKMYKSNLHSHTLFSDATIDVLDSVNRYYELGYDILATTDHGVVHQGWDTKPEMIPIFGYHQYLENLKPLTAERYGQITTGSDRGGRPMLDVDRGIELNAAVLKKNHINSFFSDYGQNYLGIENDYETSIAAVDKTETGITFINHPGDFIDSSNNPAAASNMKNIKLFGNLIIKYDSCVGIEIFNGSDSRTRNDRVLWDNMLQYTIPRGTNIWGFSNDDSHNYDAIGKTAEFFMMPELSNDALRTAMINGTFFAASTIARNELGDEFRGTGEFAVVTNISVDEADNSITVETASPETVEWIANGEIIHVGNTIDLNDYEDEITCYVRAQIANEGGILMTQAFVCDDGTLGDDVVDEPEEEMTLWDKIIAFFKMFLNTRIVEAIKKLF